MSFITGENRNEATKLSKLCSLVERCTAEELGRKPAGLCYNRLQPLFNYGQKLFLNGQRPCFMYLIDETSDSDFVRAQPRAREARRAQIDEAAADWPTAKFGYVWVEVQELLREMEAGIRPFARWARDLLLSLGEGTLLNQLGMLASSQAQAKMNAPAAGGGNEGFHYGAGAGGGGDMMVTYPMMNGAAAVGMGMYDGTPGGLYMDPNMQYVQYPPPPPHQHHPHHPHPHPYFYPQAQQIMPHFPDYRAHPQQNMVGARAAAGISGGTGQLRFRFPAYVLSLEVRTSGPRLHRDWLVSVGAALVSIQAAGGEPQVSPPLSLFISLPLSLSLSPSPSLPRSSLPQLPSFSPTPLPLLIPLLFHSPSTFLPSLSDHTRSPVPLSREFHSIGL